MIHVTTIRERTMYVKPCRASLKAFCLRSWLHFHFVVHFTVVIRDIHRELTKMPIPHRQPKLGSKEDIALIQIFI